jgi:hypothetical protein
VKACAAAEASSRAARPVKGAAAGDLAPPDGRKPGPTTPGKRFFVNFVKTWPDAPLLLPLFAMNCRKYFEQLQPDRFDDFTKGLIRTLLQGKDLNRLDARTQRQLRSILMEFERKQEWLKDKYPSWYRSCSSTSDQETHSPSS